MQTKLELYRLVAPLAGLGIWEWLPQTGEFYCNDIIRQLLELKADAELSPAVMLPYFNNPDAIRALIARAQQTRKPETAEVELNTVNGQKRCIKLHVSTVFENDLCTHLYGTVQDITEEVRIRDILTEREQRFSQAFAFAPIGMALVSLDGQWIKVNESLCQLLGYREEDFMRRTFQEFTYADDLDSDLRQLRQLLNREIESYSLEKRYYHSDGHLIWALLNVSLVRDTHGQPLYFVSQIKDISESKRHTEIISEQNSRLLNFAYIVSHNLRSHSGNIKMLTQMIAEETDDTERQLLVSMLSTNAESLMQTLEHLNEVVMIRQAAPGDLSRLSLKEEVEKTLEILAISMKNADARAEIAIDPTIKICYRQAYLDSILLNLMSNSIKYRDQQRPLIIEITATALPGKTLLKVSDNGLGIDMKKYGEKLFGLYNTFHEGKDSRGMGLFLVKNQVEAMGGSIYAESEPGVRTTFYVEIINDQDGCSL